ncbi:MAG TPA: hypothetical protein VN709_10715 [Terriglobales bacterium]|nr:hypothetical protein [Terriglobales bacterium]
MLLALAATLLFVWLLLWGVFHLAGGAIHLLLVAGLLILLLAALRSEDWRSL